MCPLFPLASDGCLQYFTGVSGQILSFNYNGASGLQLSNTDYSACIRMERNFCGIQYNACPDNGNQYRVTNWPQSDTSFWESTLWNAFTQRLREVASRILKITEARSRNQAIVNWMIAVMNDT